MSDQPGVGPDDVSRHWAAMTSSDGEGAVSNALEARDRGVPLQEIMIGLVVTAQMRVGELWAGNEWTVAQEHEATEVSESVVRRLFDDLTEPEDGPLHLVACAEREWHALPALVVAVTLRAAGRRVDYLGAGPTRFDLMDRIQASRPRAVLLSTSLTSALPRLRREIEAVRSTGTPVIVGGRALDDEGRRAAGLGATATGPAATDVLRLLDDLPERVAPAPALTHPGAREAEAIAADSDEIARDVLRATDLDLGLSGGGETTLPPDDWRVVLATFVPHVIDSLVGALLTDDPSVATETRTWLGNVLRRRQADPDTVAALDRALAGRLREYPQAVRLLGG